MTTREQRLVLISICISMVLTSATTDSKALQKINGIQIALNGGHSMIMPVTDKRPVTHDALVYRTKNWRLDLDVTGHYCHRLESLHILSVSYIDT